MVTENWFLTAAGTETGPKAVPPSLEKASPAQQARRTVTVLGPGSLLMHRLPPPTEATGGSTASRMLSGVRGRLEASGSMARPVLRSQERARPPSTVVTPGEPLTQNSAAIRPRLAGVCTEHEGTKGPRRRTWRPSGLSAPGTNEQDGPSGADFKEGEGRGWEIQGERREGRRDGR